MDDKSIDCLTSAQRELYIWIKNYLEDFSNLKINQAELENMLVKDAGVAPSFGAGFGKNSGKFARFNIACRTEILDLAIRRLTKTFM